MARTLRSLVAVLVLWCLFFSRVSFAQSSNGEIEGHVTDASGAVLQGAMITVAPGFIHTVTDATGGYAVPGIAPGDYTVTVAYVGFKKYSAQTHVLAGQAVEVDPKLDVAQQSEEILVTAVRPHAEAGQINRERAADNIVQVLSSDVITSLPNAN